MPIDIPDWKARKEAMVEEYRTGIRAEIEDLHPEMEEQFCKLLEHGLELGREIVEEALNETLVAIQKSEQERLEIIARRPNPLLDELIFKKEGSNNATN